MRQVNEGRHHQKYGRRHRLMPHSVDYVGQSILAHHDVERILPLLYIAVGHTESDSVQYIDSV